MLNAASGLTRVSTDDLKKALANLHHGELKSPLHIHDLTRVGLQHCANELLAAMRGLDDAGLRAVLVTVIAERLPRNEAKRRRAEQKL
jgi:hypothetical protein